MAAALAAAPGGPTLAWTAQGGSHRARPRGPRPRQLHGLAATGRGSTALRLRRLCGRGGSGRVFHQLYLALALAVVPFLAVTRRLPGVPWEDAARRSALRRIRYRPGCPAVHCSLVSLSCSFLSRPMLRRRCSGASSRASLHGRCTDASPPVARSTRRGPSRHARDLRAPGDGPHGGPLRRLAAFWRPQRVAWRSRPWGCCWARFSPALIIIARNRGLARDPRSQNWRAWLAFLHDLCAAAVAWSRSTGSGFNLGFAETATTTWCGCSHDCPAAGRRSSSRSASIAGRGLRAVPGPAANRCWAAALGALLIPCRARDAARRRSFRRVSRSSTPLSSSF